MDSVQGLNPAIVHHLLGSAKQGLANGDKFPSSAVYCEPRLDRGKGTIA